MPVLNLTSSGLYCAAGDFYIDPWRKVGRALITHGHSDHASKGHRAYLCTSGTAPVLRHRLGVSAQAVGYGQRLQIGAASVSFHPAGHVPGSAQIRVEVAGEVWVVSGDYKLEADGLSETFEPVSCHTFISECTFGLPIFHWRPQAMIFAEIRDWWQANRAAGRISAIAAYSLGKAQRLLAGLADGPGPVLTHRVISQTTDVLRAQGYPLPEVVPAAAFDPIRHAGALLLAPPSALTGTWADPFGPVALAGASGWMAMARRRGSGTGFVLSDHADWPGLNRAIRASGAGQVLLTHGYSAAFARWLRQQGVLADVLGPGLGLGPAPDRRPEEVE